MLAIKANNTIELRPYVSFSINLNPDKDPVTGADYVMIFNCANHGKTPALRIGFVGGIWPRRGINDDFPVINSADSDKERTNLFPGEKMSDRSLGFAANTRSRFTAEEIGQVKSGNLIFIVGLKIHYEDMFTLLHETEEFWAISYNNGNRAVSMIPGKSRIT